MEFNIETIVTIVLGIAAIWFKVDQLFWKKAAKQAAEAMNEIKEMRSKLKAHINKLQE